MEKIFCEKCKKELNKNAKFCKHCGAIVGKYKCLPHYLPPKSMLKNRYMVEESIGEGGFGITYVGRDTVLDMKIAIKEFFPTGHVTRSSHISFEVSPINDKAEEYIAEAKSKFLNEARVLARFVNEPGVVGVRDYFEDNNTAYIILDFIEGITLGQYVKRNGCFDANDLVNEMYPLLASLDKIHKANIIHRDISPDNIMINTEGELILLDFGAAREVIADKSRSLSVILKPGYAPQEQYSKRGKQGAWTDVYAICSTMYYCISGVVPEDSMERLFSDSVQPLDEIAPSCPSKISEVIMFGMELDAEDRFVDIKALIKALKNADVDNINDVNDIIKEKNVEDKSQDFVSKKYLRILIPALLIVAFLVCFLMFGKSKLGVDKEAVNTSLVGANSNNLKEDEKVESSITLSEEEKMVHSQDVDDKNSSEKEVKENKVGSYTTLEKSATQQEAEATQEATVEIKRNVLDKAVLSDLFKKFDAKYQKNYDSPNAYMVLEFLNDDDIPEMLVQYDGTVDVFQYVNGEVCAIAAFREENNDFLYSPTDKKIILKWHTDSEWEFVYSLDPEEVGYIEGVNISVDGMYHKVDGDRNIIGNMTAGEYAKFSEKYPEGNYLFYNMSRSGRFQDAEAAYNSLVGVNKSSDAYVLRGSDVAKIPVLSIESTSHASDDEDSMNILDNMNDCNVKTAWKNVATEKNVYVKIKLDGYHKISSLKIYNGLLKSKKSYAANGKVKDILIDYGNGNGIVKENLAIMKSGDENVAFSNDELNPTVIIAPDECVTDEITIKIAGTVAGSKNDDAYISEIEIFGR